MFSAGATARLSVSLRSALRDGVRAPLFPQSSHGASTSTSTSTSSRQAASFMTSTATTKTARPRAHPRYHLHPNFGRRSGTGPGTTGSAKTASGTGHARGQARHQSGYRRARNYGPGAAFGADLLYRWVTSPRFYRDCAIIGAGCAGFYVYNLEAVPVSGRRRFNWVPAEIEQQQGQAMYEQIMQEYRGRFLSAQSPEYRMVARVLQRLIPHSGLSADENHWEVHVIDDPNQMNAFVIPGGKVFVFSGILKVCQGDQGVAAVLGHEIAHNVAHHSAEQMSRYIMLLPLALIAYLGIGDVGFSLTRIITDLAFLKPGGRNQETEADYIGLMMMAEACYDPRAALAFWQRMEKLSQGEPPQFLSTHPSNHNRIAKIQEWMDRAEVKRDESGCSQTLAWSQGFNRTAAMPQQLSR